METVALALAVITVLIGIFGLAFILITLSVQVILPEVKHLWSKRRMRWKVYKDLSM